MATKKVTIKGTTTPKRIVKKAKKTDSRLNNPENTFHDSVEKLAYEIWEKRGRQPGDGISEWLEAERIIGEQVSFRNQ